VISYTVVISAANPDLSLLPGMTANVRVVVDSRDNVLKVANAALRYRPSGTNAGASSGTGDGKAAADSQASQQGGGNPAQQFRQRVFEELKPDPTQKAKLEQIFDDLRQKMLQLREISVEADRRKAGERLRAETRARVTEILTDAQKPVYERLLAELAGARAGASAAGRVWIAGPDGQPKPVEVRTGLTDGTSTEIAEGPLKEGDDIILGIGDPAGAAKKAAAPAGPRMF
jgi:HlyD family secretion protein